MDTNFKACSIPQSFSEVDVCLMKLSRMLQAAHGSSIDIKDGYDFYILALKEFNKKNLFEAFLYCDRSRYELTSAINEAKIEIKSSRFHSLRTISYFFKLYGLYAVIFASLAVFLFGFLITRFSEVSVLGVPLWAPFFAGLGASAYILMGVVGELHRYDLTSRYNRFCYMTIPLLAMVFGYMVFLISSTGFIVLGGSSQSQDFSIMFICFLAGFFTKWLINLRLLLMSRDIG